MEHLDAVIVCIGNGVRARRQANVCGRLYSEPRHNDRRGCAGRAAWARHGTRRTLVGRQRRQFQRGKRRELHVRKVSASSAARSEFGGKFAVGGAEHLDAVVARVGHGDAVARRGIVDGTGIVKLPVAVAGRAELECKLDEMAAQARLIIVEHLDAVVARVGHGDAVAVPRKGGGTRAVELPVAVAGRAERKGERAVDVEHLHAVVARVGHGDHAVRRNGNAFRRRELPVAVAGRAECKGWNAARMEHLHAVVARVGHGDHAAVRDEGDGMRLVELSDAVAARSERVGRRAVRVKHAYVVVARVGDGDHAAVAHVDALRRRELPAARAVHSERKGGGAVGIEHLHSVVCSVGDGDHAGPQGVRHAAGLGMRDIQHGYRECGQQGRGAYREQQELWIAHNGASSCLYIKVLFPGGVRPENLFWGKMRQSRGSKG